jgi:hypothetical protein
LEEKLLLEVEKLNIQDGDTIVIKSDIITIENLAKLQKQLVKSGLKDIRILRLSPEDEIQSLDEKQMNALGWFKKSE